MQMALSLLLRDGHPVQVWWQHLLLHTFWMNPVFFIHGLIIKVIILIEGIWFIESIGGLLSTVTDKLHGINYMHCGYIHVLSQIQVSNTPLACVQTRPSPQFLCLLLRGVGSVHRLIHTTCSNCVSLDSSCASHMSDRNCQAMSSICVIGSNSECVTLVLDKLGFCLRWRVNEYFNKPHGTPTTHVSCKLCR